ncbi:uncharacterized protein LOC123364119 [Mauremys mutica]|uniref:uncharacterized protein LOC123364119 n=1 Tax=Mauremys mutica TaxID=74926 RepID=UPI001D16DE6F|nr:uncharacterized protein LOC123364119 [Mauremys mutica]
MELPEMSNAQPFLGPVPLSLFLSQHHLRDARQLVSTLPLLQLAHHRVKLKGVRSHDRRCFTMSCRERHRLSVSSEPRPGEERLQHKIQVILIPLQLDMGLTWTLGCPSPKNPSSHLCSPTHVLSRALEGTPPPSPSGGAPAAPQHPAGSPRAELFIPTPANLCFCGRASCGLAVWLSRIHAFLPLHQMLFNALGQILSWCKLGAICRDGVWIK